ncbi:DUF3597 domain-containing protein [Terrihabitans sp. B22-R8]|uniref:DUF3597 domain-containing protein n=1 Tax=Terrihabitans sp. B22-R8 TaxID=3425128 RepID=UPI00403D135E
MSILGKIMSSIFGGRAEAAPAPGTAPSAGTGTTGTTTSASGGVAQPNVAAGAPGSAAGSAARPTAAPAGGNVDVAAVLDQKVKEKGQTLNWRTSIVDLMKALDLDSSLAARKELAQDLNYTGDTDDSATMNIWLHKQLMAKLAENGGKIPADLQA